MKPRVSQLRLAKNAVTYLQASDRVELARWMSATYCRDCGFVACRCFEKTAVIHNPTDPISGSPLAIPGCCCAHCEDIRAAAAKE